MPSREHHRGRRGQRGRPGDQSRPSCSRRGSLQLLGHQGQATTGWKSARQQDRSAAARRRSSYDLRSVRPAGRCDKRHRIVKASPRQVIMAHRACRGSSDSIPGRGPRAKTSEEVIEKKTRPVIKSESSSNRDRMRVVRPSSASCSVTWSTSSVHLYRLQQNSSTKSETVTAIARYESLEWR